MATINHSSTSPQLYDVIIVGAGVAGISAAISLAKLNRSVIIFEARGRTGGRVFTDKSINVDMGAQWIHGRLNNPLYPISCANKFVTKPTDYDHSKLFDKTGPVDITRNEHVRDVWGKVSHLLDVKIADCKSSGAVFSLQNVMDLVMDELKLDELDRNICAFSAASAFEHEYAAHCSLLSATNFDEGNTYFGEDCVIVDGYNQIINVLLQDLSSCPIVCPIVFDTIVKSVTYNNATDVRVQTADGTTYCSKKIIITVPLGILKRSFKDTESNALLFQNLSTNTRNSKDIASIHFEPPLPDLHITAIRSLGYGITQLCTPITPLVLIYH